MKLYHPLCPLMPICFIGIRLQPYAIVKQYHRMTPLY